MSLKDNKIILYLKTYWHVCQSQFKTEISDRKLLKKQIFCSVKNGQPNNPSFSKTHNNAFVGNIRVIGRLWLTKINIKDIVLLVIIKMGLFLYNCCFCHFIFLLNNFPYLEIKKAVIINPRSSNSRYTTHRYLGLLGAISHQRNAKYSPAQPSIIYSGSSIVLSTSFRYLGFKPNSGCSGNIFSFHIFDESSIFLPNFEVGIENSSSTEFNIPKNINMSTKIVDKLTVAKNFGGK